MHKNEHSQPTNTNTSKNDEDYLYSASNHDCTGLTPTPAKNEFEAESYEQLFHYLPPVFPMTSVSAVDDPIPPFNYGTASEDLQPKTRRNVTDQTPKSRHDYP